MVYPLGEGRRSVLAAAWPQCLAGRASFPIVCGAVAEMPTPSCPAPRHSLVPPFALFCFHRIGAVRSWHRAMWYVFSGISGLSYPSHGLSYSLCKYYSSPHMPVSSILPLASTVSVSRELSSIKGLSAISITCCVPSVMFSPPLRSPPVLLPDSSDAPSTDP